jgi:hypothetical protein
MFTIAVGPPENRNREGFGFAGFASGEDLGDLLG